MAKTALVYPKMPGSRDAPAGNCIAFEKYDGTNIHWDWDATLGRHAFVTRRDRFDLDDNGIAEFNSSHPGLEDCSSLFLNSLKPLVTDVFSQLNYFNSSEVILFTEFFGENSFAGKHVTGEPKRLMIIDVQTSNGFLAPDYFSTCLNRLPTARVVYRGRLTGRFADDVRQGRLDVKEGVVCKGTRNGQVWMAKIKTDAYMQRLKEAFADNWEVYWE